MTKIYAQFSRVQNNFRDDAKRAILECGYASQVSSMLNKIEQEAKALDVNPESIKAYIDLKAVQEDLVKFNRNINSLIKDMAAVIGVKV